MYDNVLAKARVSKIKSQLFDLALRKKMEEVERGVVRKDSIWDRLVFKKGTGFDREWVFMHDSFHLLQRSHRFSLSLTNISSNVPELAFYDR